MKGKLQPFDFITVATVKQKPPKDGLPAYLDKHVANIWMSIELDESPTGVVEQEHIDACKKLVGECLPRSNVGGMEQKDDANRNEANWSLLSQAMGFGPGRIPWPVYNRTDRRPMHERLMGYGSELRMVYPNWNNKGARSRSKFF